MLCKIRKYIFKPHIALAIIFNKVRSKIRLKTMLLKAKVRGIKLIMGKNIQINQKTLITGKGSIEIGSASSFGFIRGGVL